MIEIMLVGGILTGFSVLFMTMKLGIRKIIGYDAILDIILAVILMIFFHGTAAGMLVALMAGLVISLMMRLVRWFYGYERLEMRMVAVTHQYMPFKFAKVTMNVPKLIWVYYPPKFKWFNVTPPHINNFI